MEPEKDDVFIVRKGEIVGVYKSLTDCQDQVGSSTWNTPVSVFQGHWQAKDAEYLVSQGLKNAIFTVGVGDMKKEFFGGLVPFSLHVEDSRNDETFIKDTTKKRSSNALGLESTGETGFSPISNGTSTKRVKLNGYHFSSLATSYSFILDKKSCTLEFDGATRGNGGPAGAGAVLRAPDGSVISRLRQGLATVSSNVANYRGLILGLQYALRKGFTRIEVMGHSTVVCKQVEGLWKVKSKRMIDLYKKVNELKGKFLCFEIKHVLKDLNSEAYDQANLAIGLAGQVQVEEEQGQMEEV